MAAQTLGNAHALDAGQPTASAVLAAWRQSEAIAAPGPGTADSQTGTDGGEADPVDDLDVRRAPDERTRDIWARAGVLVNELARPALVLNLPTRAASGALWTPGEPAYLSLRLLLRAQPPWSVQGVPVFVCENPNLVSALLTPSLDFGSRPWLGFPVALSRPGRSHCAGSAMRQGSSAS